MTLLTHKKQTLRGHILIADDDRVNQKLLVKMLEVQGHQTVCVKDGYETLDALENGSFDLVLLDLMMPRMNGYEALERIRQSYGLMDLPIIIISARTDTDDVVRGLDLGANDYITKPIDLSIIRARVNTQLWLKHLMSENRKQVDDLEEMHAMRARLMHIASHDLKNPVSNIEMAEYILRERIDKDDEETVQLLDTVVESLDTMQKVISQFMNMAVLKTDRTEVEIRDINIADAVWDVMMQFMVSALNKNITMEFGDAEGIVYGDMSHFKQAFSNLVSNALKYTLPDKRIWVFTQEFENTIRVCVQDEGPGIPEDERSRLFKEFSTLSTRPTGGESSHGLGLWIAQHLMQRQHGAIGADFPDGGGAIFWIELPREATDNQAEVAS